MKKIRVELGDKQWMWVYDKFYL